MPNDESKPVPISTHGTATFFKRAKRGELALQYCMKCNKWNLSGYKYCPFCLSLTEWRQSKGLGRISSFAIVRETSHIGFKSLLPYVIADVKLTEGPELKLRVKGCDPNKIFIGQKVRIDFVHSDSNETTPVWIVS
jgi:uncharacterized OB-fold protein